MDEKIEAIKRKAIARFKNDHNDRDLAIYDIIKEMTELFDKSVEKIIKSGGEIKRQELRERKQRQTWNKIKSGGLE